MSGHMQVATPIGSWADIEVTASEGLTALIIRSSYGGRRATLLLTPERVDQLAQLLREAGREAVARELAKSSA
jgi:hypothetical protein